MIRKKVKGKVTNNTQPSDTIECKNRDKVFYPLVGSHQDSTSQIQYSKNDQNLHSNNCQTPDFTSNQLSYPISNQTQTNPQMERSAYSPESSKTTQGWNLEILGG